MAESVIVTGAAVDKPLKNPPAYSVASVDHALRLAATLQLEGSLTVAEAAERLGVARSTAHRLLQVLVYRDFAVQDAARIYHAGPVLDLAGHSRSRIARLRAICIPHLHRLVDLLDESANVTIRTGVTARFIASVESRQARRVGSREGMVFPAHRTTGGLLLLADLSAAEVAQVYAAPVDDADDRPERPDLVRLRSELDGIRRSGFAVNQDQSERGVTAIGVPVRDRDGRALAGLAVSLPSARYEKARLPLLVAALHETAMGMESDLHRA